MRLRLSRGTRGVTLKLWERFYWLGPKLLAWSPETVSIALFNHFSLLWPHSLFVLHFSEVLYRVPNNTTFLHLLFQLPSTPCQRLLEQQGRHYS